MDCQKLLQQVIGLTLVLFLVACRTSQATPTSAPPAAVSTVAPPTPTPIPPTSTPVPPTPTPAPLPDPVVFQNPQQYQVKYVVTIHNQGFAVSDLRVYQPRPIEWDAQTDLQVEQVSPPPTSEGADPIFGNGIYYWQLAGEPPSEGNTPFEIRFTFTAYETTTHIDPADIQPYDEEDPLYTLYTRSERFIEADDPLIIEIADKVAENETNPYLLARRFYDYVINTARYRLMGQGLLGAKELAATGVGECGDYSALFVALCRVKGIPARPIVGYWAISGLEQTHCWAEFYVEPFGWIPVDPTIGQAQPLQRDYYFGNMDNQRVILNKGYNISLDPPAPDNYVAPFLQMPLWWFWGNGDASALSIERTSWTVTSVP